EAFLHDYLVRIQTAVIRRATASSFAFDESLRIGEDWDFFLRLARVGKRFGYINQVHCDMLIHEGSLVANNRSAIRESHEVSKVWLRLLSDPATTEAQKQVVRKPLSKLRFDEGYAYYQQGRRREALRALWGSLQVQFSYRALKALVYAALLPPWVVQRRLAQ